MELTDHQVKELDKTLNRIIRNSLYGPCSDPMWDNLRAAADAFILLKMLGLKIDGEEDARQILEKDNICNENFLQGH